MENKRIDITLVGHAHIDAVWLWDHEETKAVLAGTFTRILDLMDEYEDVTFLQTSAQYYKWIEEERPDIFKRIEEKIRKGRWEVSGAMWVESDCNIPDGESLCRQILYGQKYFLEKFGRRARICWLPDVFGFSWILPTLLKDCGVDYFFTSKLIWQTRLPFPHFVFDWEGPDGSRVLGFQTPGLYNNLDVHDVYKQSARFEAATGYGFFLAPFGEGDHGGGLSEPLIEMVRGQKYAAKMNFGNAERYFDSLCLSGCKRDLVDTELYLNTHRGTLTTQSEAKKANKRFEFLFNRIEKLQAFNYVFGSDKSYERLDECWECLLLNQFHDALPGSSFKKVYQDMEKDFSDLNGRLLAIWRGNIAKAAAGADLSGCKNPRVFFNDLAWTVDPVVLAEAPEDAFFVSGKGQVLVSQYVGDGKHLVKYVGAKPLSLAVFDVAEGKPACGHGFEVSTDEEAVEVRGERYAARVDLQNGRIVSLVPSGSAKNLAGAKGLGSLELYQDRTSIESAWNICKGMLYDLTMVSPPKVVENGSLRTTVRVGYEFSKEGRRSSFSLDYVFHADSDIIEYALDVDWRAAYTNLQATFDYLPAEDGTRYQIAYGAIDRKDPFSDGADSYAREKWEVSGHEWAKTKLLDGGLAMVVLSDSKYGWGRHGDSMHLTLLRSPEYPDPVGMGLAPCPGGHTDQGRHRIRYGFKVASGDVTNYELDLVSREFCKTFEAEIPMGAGGDRSDALIENVSDSLFLNTVKIAEDGNGIILRLFETDGNDVEARIRLGFECRSASFCNILEDAKDGRIAVVDGRDLIFKAKANSVVSIRIRI